MQTKLKIFAIYDNKVQAYGNLILANNAKKAKADLAAALQYDTKLNPIDYDLFELGDYDALTAKIEAPTPKHICNLRSLAPKPEKETI